MKPVIPGGRITNYMHYVGTAGWSIPPNLTESGSRLRRYSATLPCVEINSSFYRSHRSTTWQRWAAETPDAFKFSVKAPKTITHEAKLQDVEGLLTSFLEQVQPLGDKTGPLLFQLPPSLAFDRTSAGDFFTLLRSSYKNEVALEPRHASWFASDVDALMKNHGIARVAADPPKGSTQAAEPGGDLTLAYYRLHGSPRTYYSSYSKDYLQALANKLSGHPNAWIIFDNTASGHAYNNAISLRDLISP